MSHYAKLTTNLIVSPNSDYSSPVAEHDAVDDLTPDEYVVRQRIEVATAGQTYYIDHYTTCTDVIIENTDATNYLTVTLRNIHGSSDITIRVLAGQSLHVPSVTPASNITLQANSAVVIAYISHCGT